jgi:hypothetical protein
MPLQTLSERERLKQEADDRALRFERLSDTRIRCQKTVERMDAQAVDRAPIIAKLQAVVDAAQKLPSNLTVSGTAVQGRGGEALLTSIGGAVRDQVLSIVFAAIGELQARDRKEHEIRSSAVAMLERVERDIAALEAENTAAERAATS